MQQGLQSRRRDHNHNQLLRLRAADVGTLARNGR